jgi:MHS family proline/betaine transporter-like MFS transporter
MKNKLSLAIISGHIVECFDVTLYGFLAVQLAPIFFPSSIEHVQNMATFGAFAAGFLARPLGALFFGYIGDRVGRKKPLLLSMVLVSIPTLIIGLLPSYDTLGALAAVILIGCRLAQGFFYGGELTGASLYVMENLEKNSLGKHIGRLISWGVLGAVLASGLSAIVNLEGMPEWSWRVLFLIGGGSAFMVYRLRKTFLETVDFCESESSKNKKQEFPWMTLLKSHKSSLFLGFLVFGLTVMPLYLTTVFGNSIFINVLGYTKSQSMLLNMMTMVLCAIVIIISGYISDKVGFYKLIVFGMTSTALVAIPSFYLLTKPLVTLWDILLFVGSLNVAGSIINGCVSIYIGRFFPVYCRYSGLAFCLTVGGALLGGTTPSMAQFLQDKFQSLLAPGFLLMGLSLVTLFVLIYMDRQKPLKAS